MDHIRQHDWLTTKPEIHFLEDKGIDDCVIEKILRNKFHDPMLSSDSEDERPRQKIDWSDVFGKRDRLDRRFRVFVAGLRPPPRFPKLSTLTKEQHFAILRILCADNPDILSLEHMPRPNKMDHKTYETLKDTYLKEQKEFLEWAKTQWVSKHCLNALRPPPTIEMIYEAEYRLKAAELGSFPKNYEMAAQIALDNPRHNCSMVHKQDLINVSLRDLPKVQIPELSNRRFGILRPCALPEPCVKHPCWFVLPHEKSTTELPLTEVHRELALYALDHGARCIASESALKCLLETNRHWSLPVTVCQCINADGDNENILVFGSEFSWRKKCAMSRTYSAYRHLLEYALVPPTEKAKRLSIESRDSNKSMEKSNHFEDFTMSDDEDDHLVINEDTFNKFQMQVDSDCENDLIIDEPTKQTNTSETAQSSSKNKKKEKNVDEAIISDIKSLIAKKESDYYTCICKNSTFERPPQRSYRRWQLRNFADDNYENIDLIVHCPHKMKGQSGEVIAEPIPEYQIELGGSKQTDDKIKSLALSLHLRKNATLLNVRVDSISGDVVRIDKISKDEYMRSHTDIMTSVANVLYESISQLQGLVPGNYILQHEPNHGTNALLYATRSLGSADKLTLDFSMDVLAEADEAKTVKSAPPLIPVLLPAHKYRKILPCAFTPYEDMVAKEPKKPPPPKPKPPQAIRWPKSKKKRGKKERAVTR